MTIHEFFKQNIKPFIIEKVMHGNFEGSKRDVWLETLFYYLKKLFFSALHPDKTGHSIEYLNTIFEAIAKLEFINAAPLKDSLKAWRINYLLETDSAKIQCDLNEFLTCLKKYKNELVNKPKKTQENKKSLQLNRFFIEEIYSPRERIIRGVRRGNFHMVRTALEEDPNCIHTLSEQKKDTFRYDNELGAGESPLYVAVCSNNIKLVQFLLNHRADPNFIDQREDHSPIHAACSKKSLPILKLLMANGSDINLKYKRKESPLYYSLRKKEIEVALYLIKKGAFIDDKFLERECLELSITVLAIRTGNLKIILAFEEKGLNILNWRDKNGATLLHHASNQNIDIVLHLLESGLDPAIKDNEGLTAFNWCSREKKDIKELLAMKMGIVKKLSVNFFTENEPKLSDDNHKSPAVKKIRNDYQFIREIIDGNVSIIKTYSRERGNHNMSVPYGNETFFKSFCGSEIVVSIHGFEYELCGNFWFYLLEGYCPKKDDTMRHYRVPGFFYANTQDYFDKDNHELEWPITYEDGKKVYRSEFFASCIKLFLDSLVFYIKVKEKSANNEEFNARLNQQIREVYIYLLLTENNMLSLGEVRERFKHKIDSLPEVIFRPETPFRESHFNGLNELSYQDIEMKKLYRKQLATNHEHINKRYTFREYVTHTGEIRYISNIIEGSKYSRSSFYVDENELLEAFWMTINSARHCSGFSRLTLEVFKADVEILLDPVYEKAQIVITKLGYDNWLKFHLERDIQFNHDLYDQYKKEIYPLHVITHKKKFAYYPSSASSLITTSNIFTRKSYQLNEEIEPYGGLYTHIPIQF